MVKQSERFVCIQIDCDKDEETPKKYQVEGYPTVLFLRSDGTLIEEMESRESKAIAEQMARVADGYKEK